ncbi:PIN domain-containing protein [Maricaulis sp.]|uniref:PIN domain-containing protein n=1 Tax=Maricaulis sp. TaxID=1486257 RepID=UPI003A8EF8FF
MVSYDKEWETSGTLDEGFVYLDTSEYRAAGFKLDYPKLAPLLEHLRALGIPLLVTPILEKEITAGIVTLVDNAAATLKQVRREAGILRGLESWNAGDMFRRPQKEMVVGEINERILSYFGSPHVENVPIDSVSIGKLLELYFAGTPPFGDGRKRKEFPDAIVAMALDSWAAHRHTKIALVSADRDFQKACSLTDRLAWYGSASDLAETLLTRREERDWLEESILGSELDALAIEAIAATPKVMLYPEGNVVEHSVRHIVWQGLKVYDKNLEHGWVDYTVVLEAEVDHEATLSWEEFDPSADPSEYPYYESEAQEYFRENVEFSAALSVERGTGEVTISELAVDIPSEFELRLRATY